jgi:hypothetical protein
MPKDAPGEAVVVPISGEISGTQFDACQLLVILDEIAL